jgi:hypothetical protein
MYMVKQFAGNEAKFGYGTGKRWVGSETLYNGPYDKVGEDNDKSND